MNGRKNGRCLSLEQEELINRLVYFQDEFEQPSEEDLKRLSVSSTKISSINSSFSYIRHSFFPFSPQFAYCIYIVFLKLVLHACPLLSVGHY